MKGLTAFKEKATGVFGGIKPTFENFEVSKGYHGGLGGYEEMAGGEREGEGPGGGVAYDDDRPDSPASFEEIERPPLRKIDKYCKAECPCMSARYTIATMACIGFMIAFGMRCNMSAAKLKGEHNGTAFMNWTVATESHVDSSFFWGYLVTQIPGGFVASKFPANKVFGLSIACSATLHLFVPVAMTMMHGHVVICVRILQGLFEGVTYPACHGIWRFWAPPMERSRLATLAFSGSYAGVVVGLPLSGLLADAVGYQAPFYAYGIFGIVWYIFWLWLCFENPRKHPAISIPELKYIEKSLGETSAHPTMPNLKTTPWKQMVRSMPLYAIIVANFCRSWNFYLLVLFQSSFLKHKFHFRIEEAGFVGSLPHLIMTTIVPFGGMLADHLRKNGIMSTTNVRKLFNCGGFGMEGIFFLFVAHAKTATGAMFALTCGVAFSGFAISGYNVNHLDIAPRYASILMGLSNGIGTLAGIIVPYALDGLIMKDPEGCWTTVFTLAACVHLVGCTFYAIFASGELQPWAEPPPEEEQKVWAPPMGAITEDPSQGGAGGYMKETSFGEAPPTYTEVSQMQQTSTVNYGATGHVANNPFAMAGATIAEESLPTDGGMGGTSAASYAATGYDYTQPTAPAAMGQLPQMPSYEQQYPQYQTQ
ncbi:vesicular glutamate transporter 1 [Stomoxys calcitrans]|uniref:Major facilitator superfamily (MFS) profile domain-containing protein n=1 Tax=Stomoxys calcitrans TaxID=35570 RepID=A0A1I8PU84_STOCA|nr:vesicular glutamate transporter 1 [Stomoxys calcitrans]XP_059220794.1 vesicular glutamate transporter 1 [Stomoxys calcitrans]